MTVNIIIQQFHVQALGFATLVNANYGSAHETTANWLFLQDNIVVIAVYMNQMPLKRFH